MTLGLWFGLYVSQVFVAAGLLTMMRADWKDDATYMAAILGPFTVLFITLFAVVELGRRVAEKVRGPKYPRIDIPKDVLKEKR